ncbi:MAG: ABC transporter substrate-binding protein [Candidatus Heimdallarchaeota archaeon]
MVQIKRKSTLVLAILTVLLVSTLITISSQAIPSEGYFFRVTILSTSDDQSIANYLAQELRRIRIDSKIVTHPQGAFESAVVSREFDIVYIDMDWPSKDVDPTVLFSKDGSANYWGIDESIPGGKENEELLEAAQLEPNPLARIDLYYQWQENLMNNILAVIPIYNKVSTYSAWGTLAGWDHAEGLVASLPYMSWTGNHTGQENASVFIDYIMPNEWPKWDEMNPLFVENTLYLSLIADPLFRVTSNGSLLPMLAESWTFNSNKTILTINLRDNVYWQTDQDHYYENETFTADDVIFSIKMYQNLSTTGTYFKWVKGLEKKSNLSLDIIIDGNKSAPGLQSFTPVFTELEKLMLPEHYLNVSVGPDGLPNTNHDNWKKYSIYGLGTGMYYIEKISQGLETVFSRNPNWWGKRADAFNEDLDMLTYKVRLLSDFNTILNEYKSGKLDIFKHYKKGLEFLTQTPYQAQTRDEFDVVYIGFNLKSTDTPEISDLTLTEDGTMTKGLAVRKAIAHIFDKTQIAGLIQTESHIIDSPFSNKFTSYINPDITKYSYNLEKAKTFMLKAGFDPLTLNNTGFTLPVAFLSTLFLAVLVPIIVKKNKLATA